MRAMNLLVFLVGIAIITLFYIQYYLVKTTYTYQVDKFKSEIEKKTDRIIKNFTTDNPILFDIDIIHNNLSTNYLNKKINRTDLVNAITNFEMKDSITLLLKKQFDNELPNISVDFALLASKYIIQDNNKSDTIFNKKPSIENKIYGNLTSLEDTFMSEKFLSLTKGTLKNNENVNYTLITQNNFYISIHRWKSIILERMKLFLIMVIISILLILGAITYALSLLIKQKKVNDVKTDLMNNITHEFKTPLTTLSIAVDSLLKKREEFNQKMFNATLQTIKRQSNQLEKLMKQVVNSSLGVEEISLKKELVSDKLFFESILADFSLNLKGKTLISNISKEEEKLFIDKFHFTNMILNILSNAKKYGKNLIEVNTSVQENIYIINVRNDGKGIKEKDQIKIFEKFYRIETGNTDTIQGLGLGLYYAKKIVQAHKGTITVESKINIGTQIKITIPIKKVL